MPNANPFDQATHVVALKTLAAMCWMGVLNIHSSFRQAVKQRKERLSQVLLLPLPLLCH